MGSKGETFDTCGIAELVAAVAALSESVLHGNLPPFSDGEVVDLMQRLEICKRRLSALDSPLIIEALNRSLPQASGAGALVPFLRQTLGVSRYDESVRVKITRLSGWRWLLGTRGVLGRGVMSRRRCARCITSPISPRAGRRT